MIPLYDDKADQDVPRFHALNDTFRHICLLPTSPIMSASGTYYQVPLKSSSLPSRENLVHKANL